MDRSLDDIISERPAPKPRGPPRSEPRRPPPPRAPRREEYPRDGVRKYRRDEPVNMDDDWVHDRFEEGRHDRFDKPAYNARGARDDDRFARGARPEEGGTKIRVDNLHYEISARDLEELFERIGPVVESRLLYDRADRSTGTAFVTYKHPRDARDAIAEFDGQSAKGQLIKLALLPTGPAGPARGGSLFDRVQQPPRSLFDRIQTGPPDARDDGREDAGGRRRRPRSESPRTRTAVPEHIDRYMPGSRGSRSPMGRRGTPRESGRRPGQRREESGRAPRGPKRDDDRKGVSQGKPKKTAQELDAEMADYFGGGGAAANGDSGSAPNNGPAASAANDDIDMVE